MATTDAKPPVAIICIGMAGSGKTTFMQRLNAHLHGADEAPYIVNLDPAVKHVPFVANIDIRDSVSYRDVMRQYNLGPNGGIMTSLNLFATKIDQVIAMLERRRDNGSISRVLVDTPGQIECFVWSASGSIITDALATALPTVVAYVVDTPRTAAPATFMANMLYACSILYKTKLPMVIVFNKTDAHGAEFAKEWMTDFEAFQRALRENEDGNEEGVGGSGYMASLLNSMSLVLDEFYQHLDVVGVSSLTGAGIDEFLDAVEVKRVEFEKEYRPEMERMRKRKEEQGMKQKKKQLEKLMRDMEVGESSGRAGPNEREELEDEDEAEEAPGKEKPAVLSDVESDEDEDEGRGWVDTDDAVPPGGEGGDDEYDGLKKRYEQALRDSGAVDGGEVTEDSELYRYLRANG